MTIYSDEISSRKIRRDAVISFTEPMSSSIASDRAGRVMFDYVVVLRGVFVRQTADKPEDHNMCASSP